MPTKRFVAYKLNAGSGTFTGGTPVLTDKRFVAYRDIFPAQDIEGETTVTGTPAPTSPAIITGKQPYDLNCLYVGGKVDLGTLSWIYQTDGTYPVFRATINAPSVASGAPPIFTTAYSVYASVTTATFLKTNLLDETMVYQASSVTNQIMVQDSHFTSVAEFKASLSGKILYYRRTTDSTWNPPILDEYKVNGGKNLFDISALAGASTVSISGSTITINGTDVSTGKTLKQLCPDLKVGDTCYLYMSDASTTANKYIWLRNGAGGGQWSKDNAKTITQADLDGIVKMYAGASGQTIVDMMIVEGSVAPTSYEPYIPPHGILRNVGVKVLDGVTDGLKFTRVSSLSTFYFSQIAQNGITTSMPILCTHFENRNAVANYVCYAGTNNITFHHSFSTVEDANAWLASQYSSGRPVTVYYPLATPVVETASPVPTRFVIYKEVNS